MATRKKSSTRKRTTKRSTKQRGRGFLSTIGSVAKFVKDHKLISKGLGMIPHPAGQAASYVAGLVGLGRKKRSPAGRASTRRRVVHVHAMHHNVVAATARKRKVTRRKGSLAPVATTQLGRGIFSDLGGGIGNIASGVGHGLFGNGRKKRSQLKRRSVIAI